MYAHRRHCQLFEPAELIFDQKTKNINKSVCIIPIASRVVPNCPQEAALSDSSSLAPIHVENIETLQIFRSTAIHGAGLI